MALECVHVCVSINGLTVVVDYWFSVKVLIIVKWVVALKSVSIDSHRLLLEVVEVVSNGRFIGRFLRYNISLSAAVIYERECWWFVPLVRS